MKSAYIIFTLRHFGQSRSFNRTHRAFMLDIIRVIDIEGGTHVPEEPLMHAPPRR